MARYWRLPAEAHPGTASPSDFVAALSQYWSIASVVDSLASPERLALRMIVSQPRATLAIDTLVRSLDLTTEDALRAVRRLRDLGLVAVGPAATEIVDGKAPWAEARSARGRMLQVPIDLAPSLARIHQAQASGDTSDRPLEAMLEAMSVTDVQALARRWDIERPHELFRRDLITAILDRFQDVAAVEQAIAAAGDDAERVVATLLEHGRRRLVHDLEDQLGEAAVATAWRHLRPLLVLRDSWQDGRRWLIMPAEISRREHFLQSAPALPVQPAPAHAEDHRFSLAADLITIVDAMRWEPIRLTLTSQRIPKRVQSSIIAQLRIREGARAKERFEFLVHTALRVGLLESGPNGYIAAVEAEGVLTSGFDHLQRLLFESWRSDATWYEPVGYEGMYWAAARPAARRKLLSHLGELAPGLWFRLGDLVQRIRATDPYFMRARHDILRYRGSRALTEAMETWDQVEGRLIRTVIEGPLLWLGAIAVSRDEATGDVVWLLTPLGAWLLDPARPSPDPAERESVLVQPTFEVVAIDARPSTLHCLNQIGRLSRPDVAALYVLERETIARSVQHGWSADAIVDFLERASKRALPQNVGYTIREWASKLRRATLRASLLIEFDDEAAADAWLSSPEAEGFAARRISPAVAALPVETNEAELAGALRERGILVRPSAPDPAR